MRSDYYSATGANAYDYSRDRRDFSDIRIANRVEDDPAALFRGLFWALILEISLAIPIGFWIIGR
jgi:hypothetical protein